MHSDLLSEQACFPAEPSPTEPPFHSWPSVFFILLKAGGKRISGKYCKGHLVSLCAGQFYISSTQTRVILKEGTSLKKTALQTGLLARLWYSLTDD